MPRQARKMKGRMAQWRPRWQSAQRWRNWTCIAHSQTCLDMPRDAACAMLAALTTLRHLRASMEISVFNPGASLTDIAAALVDTPGLESLDISQHSIYVFMQIDDAHLAAHSRLRDLHFAQDSVAGWPDGWSGLCAAKIAALAPSWRQLRQLDLRSTILRDADMEVLAGGLSALTALQLLSLREHRMRVAGASALASALQHMPDLRHLDLSTAGAQQRGAFSMGAEAAAALLPAIAAATRLRLLSFAGAGLGTAELRKLLKLCSPLTQLAELSLSDHALQRDAVQLLVKKLSAFPALATLRLKGCGLDHAQCARIKAALRQQWRTEPSMPVAGMFVRFYPGCGDFCSIGGVELE